MDAVTLLLGAAVVGIALGAAAYVAYIVFVILQENGKYIAQRRRKKKTERLMADPYTATLTHIKALERELELGETTDGNQGHH